MALGINSIDAHSLRPLPHVNQELLKITPPSIANRDVLIIAIVLATLNHRGPHFVRFCVGLAVRSAKKFIFLSEKTPTTFGSSC